MEKCACTRVYNGGEHPKNWTGIVSLHLSRGVKCLWYLGGLSLIAMAQGCCGCSPGAGVGLPRGVVAEISCQELPSTEFWPGEIRAEIQLSDGGGLARRPRWLTAEAMEAAVTHLGLCSLCLSAHILKVLTKNPLCKLLQTLVLWWLTSKDIRLVSFTRAFLIHGQMDHAILTDDAYLT